MWCETAQKYFYDPQEVLFCLANASAEPELYKDMVWEQFVGLLDKDGKEIYEGDIVIGKFENAQTGSQKKLYSGIIHWNHSNFAIGEYKLFIMEDKTLKVIGNIHQNKDLLK